MHFMYCIWYNALGSGVLKRFSFHKWGDDDIHFGLNKDQELYLMGLVFYFFPLYFDLFKYGFFLLYT